MSWQGYDGFAAHAKSLFKNPTLSDVTLLLDNDGSGPEETKAFVAHRLVLCTVSEYFKVMFTGSFVEANQSEVRLHGVPYSAFERCMECVYCGWQYYPRMNWPEAAELWQVSRMLLMEARLQDKIVDWISEHVMQWERDLLEMLSFAIDNDLRSLSRLCMKHCVDTTNEILMADSLTQLPLAAIQQIVEQRYLNCRRHDLKQAVKRWVTENKLSLTPQDEENLYTKVMGHQSVCYNGKKMRVYKRGRTKKPKAVPVVKRWGDGDDRYYTTKLDVQRCLVLFGVSFILKTKQPELTDRQIELHFYIYSYHWNSDDDDDKLVERKIRMKLNTSQHDKQPLQVFFAPVQCCSESSYSIAIGITKGAEHSKFVKVEVEHVTKLVTLKNSHVSHLYYRDVTSPGEKCEQCSNTSSGSDNYSDDSSLASSYF